MVAFALSGKSKIIYVIFGLLDKVIVLTIKT